MEEYMKSHANNEETAKDLRKNKIIRLSMKTSNEEKQ